MSPWYGFCVWLGVKYHVTDSVLSTCLSLSLEQRCARTRRGEPTTRRRTSRSRSLVNLSVWRTSWTPSPSKTSRYARPRQRRPQRRRPRKTPKTASRRTRRWPWWRPSPWSARTCSWQKTSGLVPASSSRPRPPTSPLPTTPWAAAWAPSTRTRARWWARTTPPWRQPVSRTRPWPVSVLVPAACTTVASCGEPSFHAKKHNCVVVVLCFTVCGRGLLQLFSQS